MKKLLGSIVVVLFAVGLSYAVPSHFTETLPAQAPYGSVPVSNGYDWTVSSGTSGIAPTVFTQTVAQICASTATAVGQLVYCSNCAAAGGAGTVCISTSIAAPGAGCDFVLSTGTQCK